MNDSQELNVTQWEIQRRQVWVAAFVRCLNHPGRLNEDGYTLAMNAKYDANNAAQQFENQFPRPQ